jgi:hypothetical protein
VPSEDIAPPMPWTRRRASTALLVKARQHRHQQDASTVFLDLRRIKSVSLNANCALPVRFQEKNKLNLASHANPIKLLVIYLALLSVHDAQQDRLP